MREIYLYVRDFVVLVFKKNYYTVIYWGIDNKSGICDSKYRNDPKLDWNLVSGLKAQGSGFRAQGSGLKERVLGKREQKELTEKDKRKLLDTEPITTSLEVQRSRPTY